MSTEHVGKQGFTTGAEAEEELSKLRYPEWHGIFSIWHKDQALFCIMPKVALDAMCGFREENQT
jgi:hypothetical protein